MDEPENSLKPATKQNQIACAAQKQWLSKALPCQCSLTRAPTAIQTANHIPTSITTYVFNIIRLNEAEMPVHTTISYISRS
ncbi:hypothetical protein D5086_002140 [Populus alba]|uniref:Uncharacterized protein n=1 Tax=Populus alba TaxID=43335 RepID=A0ACC4D0V8_POPAL